jgi:hypothetical protein
LGESKRGRRLSQGERAVILVGASRIQAALHPDIFEQVTGKRPLVLAIDGSSPIPVLENLGQQMIVLPEPLFARLYPCF